MYGAAKHALSAALEGRRDRALVATKVWTPDDAEAERQIDRAMGYYGGRVDINQIHNLVALSRRQTRQRAVEHAMRVQVTTWSTSCSVRSGCLPP
jgi:diketogulonate reductase-like aldo/keto reductase